MEHNRNPPPSIWPFQNHRKVLKPLLNMSTTASNDSSPSFLIPSPQELSNITSDEHTLRKIARKFQRRPADHALLRYYHQEWQYTSTFTDIPPPITTSIKHDEQSLESYCTLIDEPAGDSSRHPIAVDGCGGCERLGHGLCICATTTWLDDQWRRDEQRDLLFTVIHRIHQVWDPWRIDGGNVMIFLILSFSCLITRTYAYHDDTEPFPHSLCAAIYMLHPVLYLTLFHALSFHIPYVYLLYSLLLQHGCLLYILVDSYIVL